MNARNYKMNQKGTIEELLSLGNDARNLYCVSSTFPDNKRLEYFKMQAKTVGAGYFYCYNSEIEDQPVPFIYIYDERRKSPEEYISLVKINKQIWTLGEVAIAVIVYDDEFKIIDTRKPITSENEADILCSTVQKIDAELKHKIFEGRILEETNDYKLFSPYQKLLNHIEKEILDKKAKIGCSEALLRKVLVRFILIKYLEEQTDENGDSVFGKTYFYQFLTKKKCEEDKDVSFCDVLRSGNIPALFESLNAKFNGGIFNLLPTEKSELLKSNFSVVANALDGSIETNGQLSIWRYYDFNLLPIEFISRLYERFVVTVEGKQKATGAYYTPPHLARLLVDELLPFDKEIDFKNFKILDPSCGSGIFLVLAYKRLITLWLLSNHKQALDGEEDIKKIKEILTDCIYGVDINEDALSITAASLQIELTSHIKPKEIWDKLRFDNLEEQGHLTRYGFFKWYKGVSDHFDIIVGNPPFNIGKEEQKRNIEQGYDDDYSQEYYMNYEGKKKQFPDNNPALIFLYRSLDKLLKPDVGVLFMVMPASTFLYIPSSFDYRKSLASAWNIRKVYDFTPLKSFLWGKTKVATVAVMIYSGGKTEVIEHVVVRNSVANKNGAIRFQIDKYDKFYVPLDFVFSKDFIWKVNLLGGGYLELLLEKSKTHYLSIEDFFKKNKIISNVGYQRDSLAKNKVNLKGKRVIVSSLFNKDLFDEERMTKIIEKDDWVRLLKDESFYDAPNILIRLNINLDIPIFYNAQYNFMIPKGILIIKGKNTNILQQFVSLFLQNRELFKFLIKAYSPKVFIQQNSGYSIDADDFLRLPVNTDESGKIIPFEPMSTSEMAVMEETTLIMSSIDKEDSKLFNSINDKEVCLFEETFCQVINDVYGTNGFKFTTVRRIINPNFIWITFEHTNHEVTIETLFQEEETLFDRILSDTDTNRALNINRIITYYGEKNRISFIKPNKLKYWMRTIAYRDAENVKGNMYKEGY
jgi:hypothetical protein